MRLVETEYEQPVTIAIDQRMHAGTLGVPQTAVGFVLFAHGSGSSRLSPRNTFVARVLQEGGVATLLFDLLTEDEDRLYPARFDIDLLTRRLLAATEWVTQQPQTRDLNLGYFGASTGAAAALMAAAECGKRVRAVVSRGGRPDLAMANLPRVQAATLLIVGARDELVLGLNEQAYARLPGPKELKVVSGATHLFEEPGALQQVARLARDWFAKHLQKEGRA